MHKDITAIFKGLFKKSEESQKTKQPFLGSSPSSDWQKLIIVFLILNLLIILWSGYLFWQIQSGDIFGINSSSNAKADQNTETKLRQTLTTYEGREKHFEEVRVTPAQTADPVS